ncbi:hypothetical protein BO71DRAFT_50320 [Aspergillus ellipticus CBS 707.79]|uniref:Uncharacterized protein n=1 Tax=Aspergillus ellipticus CBS 707.79 TaxID=1448320 RepID=A0A319DLP5_9EURO|nr:hypothetical protein BO71DRAFT_50320 [Aspergillus ellipticus CBS 707.79]
MISVASQPAEAPSGGNPFQDARACIVCLMTNRCALIGVCAYVCIWTGFVCGVWRKQTSFFGWDFGLGDGIFVGLAELEDARIPIWGRGVVGKCVICPLGTLSVVAKAG